MNDRVYGGMTVNLLMCDIEGTHYSVNAATQTYHPRKMGSENMTSLYSLLQLVGTCRQVDRGYL